MEGQACIVLGGPHAKGWFLDAGRSAGEAGADASRGTFSGPLEGELFATQASQAEPLLSAAAEARAPARAQAWAPHPSAEEPAAAYREDASAAAPAGERHLQRATDATARFAWELLGEHGQEERGRAGASS